MMIELLLLKYLLTKHTYHKYYKFVSITNKELLKIYHVIKVLQESATKEVSSTQDLELTFLTEYPFLKQVEKDAYSVIFSRIEGLELEADKLVSYLEKQRKMVLAGQLATLAMEVHEGRKDFQDILDHVESLDVEASIDEPIQFVSNRLTELYNDAVATPGLRWRMDCLNHSLGSLRRGDFGFLFARPETGKTTFLASEVTYMAEQADGPILWFNNEEQGKKVSLRCIQAATGATQAELTGDFVIQANEDEYLRITKDNIKIFDSGSIHKHDVERVCKQMQPSLILFDQIDKIKGFEGDRPDLVLGATYQWARELAKTYAPVIGVCQADGTGEGVKWLTMGHVANAKTSKQAEADWILGIGRSNDEGLSYIRHFNISKNKLTGDKDTRPDMRHGRFDCVIKPEIARYLDV